MRDSMQDKLVPHTLLSNHARGVHSWLAILAVLFASHLTRAALADDVDTFPRRLETPKSDEDVIQLPIRFHIIRTTLTKDRVEMGMWLAPPAIEESILPEVNRIWRPAGIQWFVEQILEEDPLDRPSLKETLDKIAGADRSTKNRTKMVMSLPDPRHRHAVINNVYFVPFVGSTSQGFALFGGFQTPALNPDGGSRCYVGVWTDKPTRGRSPPQQFPLVEPPPFQIGSIARTVSHELGHNLLLKHPDADKQTEFRRLMGGRQHGYRLIASEITTARRTATGRVRTINRWVERQQLHFESVDKLPADRSP